MKPKDWDLFLEYIVDEYHLQGRLKELFKVRFAFENWRKPDMEIWELAEAPSLETYKKQMTQLYSFFSYLQPNGCPELDPTNKGPGKFDILRGWLRDMLYPQWARQKPTEPNIISSSKFGYIPYLVDQIAPEMQVPGSLLRIRAPEKMGKTILVRELLRQASTMDYKIVYLNLHNAEADIFSSLDRFLRWFCANISLELALPPLLDDYWDKELFGSLVSCKSYFQGYILAKLEQPLVIGLDNLDRIFAYPLIAADFLPMLRYWHEESKTEALWQKLRLVLALSSEIYVELDIHQSPFNVGKLVKIQGFELGELMMLAQSYQLELPDEFAQKLLSLTGGHPYLLKLALEALVSSDMTTSEILSQSSTHGSIYGEYLHRLWDRLQQDSTLLSAFNEIIQATGNSFLDPDLAYKLESMGLIKLQGNEAIVACQLYKEYFKNRLQLD